MKKKTTSINLSVEVFDALDDAHWKLKISKSEIIEDALIEYLRIEKNYWDEQDET